MTRLVSALLALLLGAVLIVAILLSSGVFDDEPAAQVVGFSGSEKIPYLTDPRVVERLNELGFELDVRSAGSRQIATETDLSTADFAFPAGSPAADKIRAERSAVATFTPFVTPMVVASWREVTDGLVDAGVATDQGGWLELDTAAYLDLFDAGTRWNDIGFDSDRRVLVTSTDVRRSNSAAMYLALTSYARNDDTTVADRATADTLLPELSPLFLEQGYSASSTQGPFDAYLVRGPGAIPMVMIYEAQFVATAAAENSAITDDMVMLYPQPTLFTTHTLVAFTEEGEAFGQALGTDPRLIELATEYGFRADAAAFAEFTAANGLDLPPSLTNTIEPPRYEILEHLIMAIEQEYQR